MIRFMMNTSVMLTQLHDQVHDEHLCDVNTAS